MDISSSGNYSNRAFLVNTDSSFADRVQKPSNSLTFDCMHSFDPLHIATFFKKQPTEIHRRLALYIMLIYIDTANVDDLRKVLIERGLKELIKEERMSSQELGWLEHLKSNRIMETYAETQKELGGYDNFQEEFTLCKRKLLKTSNKLSRGEFQKFISSESHKHITEVIGFIYEVNMRFLDKICTLQSHTENERHLTYVDGNRRVEIHLFSAPEDSEHTLKKFRSFASRHELQLNASVGFKRYKPLEADDPFFGQIGCRAYFAFDEWRKKYEHTDMDSEIFLAWFCEAAEAGEYIKSYADFVNFLQNARNQGLRVENLNEELFNSMMGFREIKRILQYRFTDVFPKDISFEERLTTAEQVYKTWMWTYKEALRDVVAPPKADKKQRLAYLEAFNAGMNLFYSTNKRRETALYHQSELDNVVKRESLSEVRDEVEKVTRTYSLSLVDLLPVTDGSFCAKELRAALQQYLDLVRISREACMEFRNGKILNPHVGENSCQIRAAMYAEIRNKPDIDQVIINAIQQLDEIFKTLVDLLEELKEEQSKIISLKTYLRKRETCFEISEEIAIIISSYILTDALDVTKQTKPNNDGVLVRSKIVRLQPAKLQKKGLSKIFAGKLIELAQRKLSESSVIYIRRLAFQRLASKEEKEAAALAFSHVKKDKLQRVRVPFYHTLRLLMSELHRTNVPLVFRIKQFVKNELDHYGKLTLIYHCPERNQYVLNENPSSLERKWAICFSAKSITDQQQSTAQLRQQFLQAPAEAYVFSAGAAHPDVEMDLENNEALLADKKRALELGACYENPTRFTVQHVTLKPITPKIIADSMKP